ncbi:MAG: hypothetical protein JW844_04165 [Candidatus Omnitrophica bacterium]|nr:hypothetical protein [Candidatus Omnitrophota bacterium]
MAYISNILTHWAVSKKDEGEQYSIFTEKILKKKELRFGNCKLSFLSKFFKDIICEMISFTDIPLSECESHCANYSKFGISFEKAYLTNLYTTPVAYSQNPAFFGNLDYVFEILKRVNEILIKNGEEKFDLNDKEKGYTINGGLLPLLKHILSYYEEYDKDKEFPYSYGKSPPTLLSQQESFFENIKAGYFEREWRLIPSSLFERDFSAMITDRREDGYRYFKFEEKYVKYIIMPKGCIPRFNQEKENIFLEYNNEDIPSILAYEDLKSM